MNVNRQQDADTSEVGSTTINSSVYHGESERETGAQEEQGDVATTRSVVSRSKLIPKAVGAPSSALLLEDVLVGHELGEKPLLADDELDDDRISSSLTSEKSILRLLTIQSLSSSIAFENAIDLFRLATARVAAATQLLPKQLDSKYLH